ncbi:lipase [Longispora sp. K20-0274]|uniref:lipase n=1 Tax=Longispora sp. K20-0274 TaxID=3088255 RepID=UPI00399ABBDD
MRIYTGRRAVAGLLLAALVAGTVGAAAGPATASGDARGRLVSATPMRTYHSAEEVAAALRGAEFDDGAVRYGVDTYRLVYRTVDVAGRPTTASGLLVLPRTDQRELRTVSYSHGTTTYRGDAPSMPAEDGWGQAPAITYAAAGFAAVTADYLGLGTGPGLHPWMDIPSETTASVDLLRAAREFVPKKGKVLKRQVMVAGFSQGASAALGLGRELQAGGDPWFRLAALAPISGAYDLRAAELPALLDKQLDTKLSVLYSALFLVSFNRQHHLYDNPAEVFQDGYATRIEALFDGTVPGRVLFRDTPDTVGQLLTPHGFDLLRDPPERLAAALRVTDAVCADWTPKVPVRLFEIAKDEQAANANTASCVAALTAHGVDPHLTTFTEGDYHGSAHLSSNIQGTAATVRWFAQL